MRFLLLAILLSGLLHLHVKANENTFSATPSECVTTKKGALCVMTVALTYPPLTADQYCLMLNRQQQGCWLRGRMPDAIKVELKQDSTLSLISKADDYHESVLLTLRYRSASMLRRRVKNPWSLF